MHYLHTTGKRSYTIGNITIPPLAQSGRRQEWLKLDEAGLQKLKEINIIRSLIDRGEIAVYDKVPNESIMDAYVSNQQLAALKERVAKLTDENKVLHDELDRANLALKNGSSGNARSLKALQEKYDALSKEHEELKRESHELVEKYNALSRVQ